MASLRTINVARASRLLERWLCVLLYRHPARPLRHALSLLTLCSTVDAMQLVMANDPLVTIGVVATGVAPHAAPGDPAHATVFLCRTMPQTFAAVTRLLARRERDAQIAAAAAIRAVANCSADALTAEEVHSLAALTITLQSDYAAQFTTQRAATATCAQRERQNLLVSIVGYKPYAEMMKPAGRGKKSRPKESVRKQHVDIFYAFHAPNFKPSARSFNVVQYTNSDLHSTLKPPDLGRGTKGLATRHLALSTRIVALYFWVVGRYRPLPRAWHLLVRGVVHRWAALPWRRSQPSTFRGPNRAASYAC